MDKYSPDNLEFADPVVRCCDCSSLIIRKALQTEGGCPKCGNKRVRNVLTLSKEEMGKLRGREDIDPDFLALFEASDEDAVV